MKMDLSEAARLLGKKGGAVKSPRKTAAARINGKKGGRPPNKIYTVKALVDINTSYTLESIVASSPAKAIEKAKDVLAEAGGLHKVVKFIVVKEGRDD